MEMGMVACACHPYDGRKLEIVELHSRVFGAKSETLSPKQLEQKGLEVWLK
jgi:hypothetical protein